MTTVRSNNARQQNPYYCRTVLNPSIFQIILDKLNEGGPFVIDNPTVRQALHVVLMCIEYRSQILSTLSCVLLIG